MDDNRLYQRIDDIFQKFQKEMVEAFARIDSCFAEIKYEVQCEQQQVAPSSLPPPTTATPRLSIQPHKSQSKRHCSFQPRSTAARIRTAHLGCRSRYHETHGLPQRKPTGHHPMPPQFGSSDHGLPKHKTRHHPKRRSIAKKINLFANPVENNKRRRRHFVFFVWSKKRKKTFFRKLDKQSCVFVFSDKSAKDESKFKTFQDF
jgi:hypothetical protein